MPEGFTLKTYRKGKIKSIFEKGRHEKMIVYRGYAWNR